MALEDIFRALEEQADSECEDILAAARAQAEATIDEADEQANSICATCVEASDAAVRMKAVKRLNENRLEAKKRVAAVKEAAVAAAFESAGHRLGSIRESAGYPALLRELLEEALDGDTGGSTVLVDACDVALVSGILPEIGIQAEVKPGITTSGGVVLIKAGGRVLRRNTLEDRLEKVRHSVQSAVAEILFT